MTNLMYVARILQDARVVLGQGSISAASGRTCVPYTRGEDREYSRGFHHHYYSEFYEFNDGVIPKLRPTTGKEYCASVCALRHTHPVPIHQCATHPTTNFFKIELNELFMGKRRRRYRANEDIKNNRDLLGYHPTGCIFPWHLPASAARLMVRPSRRSRPSPRRRWLPRVLAG